MTMNAVHAAAAPLVSEKGGTVFDKFTEAMMNIIRPLKQLSLFDRLKQKALAQEAERKSRQAAA